jgi:hypothetical protein
MPPAATASPVDRVVTARKKSSPGPAALARPPRVAVEVVGGEEGVPVAGRGEWLARDLGDAEEPPDDIDIALRRDRDAVGHVAVLAGRDRARPERRAVGAAQAGDEAVVAAGARERRAAQRRGALERACDQHIAAGRERDREGEVVAGATKRRHPAQSAGVTQLGDEDVTPTR